MGTNDWTDSEKIVLKKMWLDGRSSRECAAALPGRTHSACIGQARRLGLPIRDISKDNVGRKRRSIAQKDKVPPAAGAASKPRAPPSIPLLLGGSPTGSSLEIAASSSTTPRSSA